MRKKLLGLFACLSMVFTGVAVSVAPTEVQAQSYRYDRGGPGVRRGYRARQYRNVRRARAYRGYRADRRARAYRGYRADRRARAYRAYRYDRRAGAYRGGRRGYRY